MNSRKYCIMDMDGTIVDSMPYWNRLSPDYLNSKGIEGDFDDLMARIKTMTMPEACVFLKQQFNLEEEPEKIQEQLGEVMRGHYEKDIPLKKGVRSSLEKMRGNGATLCIVSATASPLVRLCLERLGVWNLFSFALSCEDVGYGKDRPDAFLEAARRMGARPDETAVYEDAGLAIRAAKAAGFYTVGVFDRYCENWEEIVRTADEVITEWGC